MKKKLYCFYCDKDINPIIKKVKSIYTIHKENVELEEEKYLCPFCNEEIIDDNLDNSLFNIYNAYLKLYDLSFDLFKQIRISLNLSQELFATALGWSKKTINRYENAQSLPQKEYLLTYKKILNNKDEFINILNFNKNMIDKKVYYNILKKVNAELDAKTINVILYVLKDNFLNQTQIMKNLFALDFLSKKELGKPITLLNYAHGPHGPIIDNKDAYLNILIRQNYIEFMSDKNENIIFKPKQEIDLNLFDEEEIKIIKKVLKKLKGKSANKLSDWSHTFKGWIETKDGEKINYKYAKYFDLDTGW